MINIIKSNSNLRWPALFIWVGLLSACSQPEPSVKQIKNYIENYHIAHNYQVVSMRHEVVAEQPGQSGSIQVSGQLELTEPLYVEDAGNRAFRDHVAKMLRRNRFSDLEIKHDIYARVIRASARIPNSESEYYTFLKVEHEPGLEINFSAELKYQMGNDGFAIDGSMAHAKLLGVPAANFSNPVIDDTELVQQAVIKVLAEQTRYSGLMKESRDLLTQLWDNDFGLTIWNRKVPYLGNENLSPDEQSQLTEFAGWRAVYHISNVKPVQYRTPRSSNFFESGYYTTEGIATCLRQTGFINELTFLKSNYHQYCDFGKRYPVTIKLGSNLNDANVFIASVQFDVNGVSSGEFLNDPLEFTQERNQLARFSDQQRITILEAPFDITQHDQAVLTLFEAGSENSERLSLRYPGASNFDLVPYNVDSKNEPIRAYAEPNTGEQVFANESVIVSEATPIVDPNRTKHMPQGLTVAETEAYTKMVRATQAELKRLGVYGSQIDGIAAQHTYLSMQYVQKKLGRTYMKVPSAEFLALLRKTPTGSMRPPEPVESSEPLSQPVEVEQNKGTIFGNAFRRMFKKKES